jgi:hypothetical protein
MKIFNFKDFFENFLKNVLGIFSQKFKKQVGVAHVIPFAFPFTLWAP